LCAFLVGIHAMLCYSIRILNFARFLVFTGVHAAHGMGWDRLDLRPKVRFLSPLAEFQVQFHYDLSRRRWCSRRFSHSLCSSGTEPEFSSDATGLVDSNGIVAYKGTCGSVPQNFTSSSNFCS